MASTTSDPNDSLQTAVPVDDRANGCFVCGEANPFGLRVRFRLDGDVCRADFTPDERHQGYSGVMHGGLLFSLLDDVMANWLWLQGHACFTARSDVRYREPVALHEPLLLEGRLLRSRGGRLFDLQGQVLDAADGRCLVEAEGRFMRLPPKPEQPASEPQA